MKMNEFENWIGTISKRVKFKILRDNKKKINNLPSCKISRAVFKFKLHLSSLFRNLTNVSKHRFLKEETMLFQLSDIEMYIHFHVYGLRRFKTSCEFSISIEKKICQRNISNN